MAERTVNDLARNDLVSGTACLLYQRIITYESSVLLRSIERFEGILFLTTNRVEVIDFAFKSRIHFRIAYPALSAEARSDIWKVFVTQGVQEGQGLDWVDSRFLTAVSKFDLNGREIKNALRVARALAIQANRELKAEDIYETLNCLKSFDEGFSEQVQHQMQRGMIPN